MLDLIGAPPSAVVVGIDIVLTPEAKTLSHPRLHLYEGSSTDPEVIRRATESLPAEGGLVVLDSDHRKAHVAAEIEAYKQFVPVNGYMVVEDTNINGHPAKRNFGPGPHEAVRDFLKRDKTFVRDDALWKRNKFSFHQRGWLKRVQ
jgi:cephalosporin hydroxylase